MGSSWEPSSSSSVSWPLSYPFPSPMRRRQNSVSLEVQRWRRSPRLPLLPPTRGQRRRRRRSGRSGGRGAHGFGLGDSPPGIQHPASSHRLSLSLARGLRSLKLPLTTGIRTVSRPQLCRPPLPLPSLPRRGPRSCKAHRVKHSQSCLGPAVFR